MADSIKTYGVFQPIIVKKSIKGYDLVAGERRVKASRLAGMETIPAIVKDFSDEMMREIALLENLQRENLTAIELAWAYKGIIDSLHITQEELATKILASGDQDKINEYMKEIQVYLAEDIPVLPMVSYVDKSVFKSYGKSSSKRVSPFIKPSEIIMFSSFPYALYGIESSYSAHTLSSIFWATPRAPLTHFVYARTRPPAPRSIPPKYLVTTIQTPVSPSRFITSSIGIPAVPEGSPSSENLAISVPCRIYA